MTAKITSPTLERKSFSATALGVTINVTAYGVEPQENPDDVVVQAYGGEVNALQYDIASVSEGLIAPRPGGGTSLNLLDYPQGGQITAELVGGGQALISVSKCPQERGMPSGVHYYLPIGPNNRAIAEPGQRHRKIYVSNSPSAMTKAAIAAHATAAGTPTTEAQVTTSWLVARPIYGGSEDMAVTDAIGRDIFFNLNGQNKPSRSDWYLLERGYTYPTPAAGVLYRIYLRGEDELHPLVIGAWGTGARPHLLEQITVTTTSGVKNMVIRDVHPLIFYPKQSLNVLAENVLMTRDEARGIHEHTLRDIRYVTYREMRIVDVWAAKPRDGRLVYDDSKDRSSGVYAANPQNWFIDGCIIDQCGAGPGARSDANFDPQNPTPMPHGTKSHNLYLSYGCGDFGMRDSVSARSGNSGIQGRTGGQYDGVVWLDNQINASISYGDKAEHPTANLSNNFDNVCLSAGRRLTVFGGKNGIGMNMFGYRHSAVGCVIAHAADPNNPAEIAAKGGGQEPIIPDWAMKHDDTKIYNWSTNTNRNLSGLNLPDLNMITTQIYAASVLGITGTIEAFLLRFRDESVSIGQEVRDFVKWVQDGFGIERPERTTPADLVFVPDARLDGFRWDNRYNWPTGDLPGTHIADTVDLGGNFVRFGTVEANIAALKSSGAPALDVTSGKLETGAVLDATAVDVRNSGQFFCGATSAPLTIRSDSGRTAFTGAIDDLDLLAEGHGQVLLGPEVTARNFVISGQKPMVGWDGTGAATLTVTDKLEFRIGATLAVGSSLLRYQYMIVGNTLTGPNWTAKLADYEDYNGSTQNRMWVTDLTSAPTVGDSFVIGYFLNDDVNPSRMEPWSVSFTSIQSAGVAPLQIFKRRGDDPTPTVTPTLVLPSGLDVVVSQNWLLTSGTSIDLTLPGITVTNNGANLQAGVTISGGKLIYTKP